MAGAAAAASSLVEHIHHERQEPGSMLCAQHALNALLQGNFYDPSQLADVAKQLDELEQDQVDEETWRTRDRDSLNMDDTGFFSVSVLEAALQVWGFRLVRWRSEEMRAFQREPENQLAFVLNLESHWFTIRGFQGGYWFNLNSFLEKPSWVGPSYLGALLDAAESEGYSVFVVVQADDTRGDFHSSTADECAATLPPASVMDESSGTSLDDAIDASAQGLRPTKVASSSAFNDEEADLQAALRASLAEVEVQNAMSASSNAATAAAATTTTTAGSSAQGSRLHSPTIIGQRRTRSRGLVGGAGPADAEMMDEAETDEQLDEIAPSRRRVRGLGGSALTSSSAATSSRGSPYILPTASGGRRRASRQHSEEGDQASFRRRRQRDAGTTRDTAINVDDDGDETQRQMQPDGALRGESIDLADDDDEEDDFVQMHSTSAPRSPFLNPAMVRSGGGSTSDDDFHSLSSGDEGALGESWVANDLDAIRRQAVMQSRRYDDEDAQLQAALAASMRETGQSTTTTTSGDASSGVGGESFEDDLAAASWINEEDSRAIREAQASFSTMVRQMSNRSNSPPPADVERIARMRAEAKQKLQEEEEARLRGESADKSTSQKDDDGGARSGEDSDDESEDDEQQMSPEEMRRARLARFGAP